MKEHKPTVATKEEVKTLIKGGAAVIEGSGFIGAFTEKNGARFFRGAARTFEEANKIALLMSKEGETPFVADHGAWLCTNLLAFSKGKTPKDAIPEPLDNAPTRNPDQKVTAPKLTL